MDKDFKVLRIDELTRIGETGNIQKFYRHQVKSKSGVIFTVDIPEANFTAEKAQPILLAKAQEVDKIMAL